MEENHKRGAIVFLLVLRGCGSSIGDETSGVDAGDAQATALVEGCRITLAKNDPVKCAESLAGYRKFGECKW